MTESGEETPPERWAAVDPFGKVNGGVYHSEADCVSLRGIEKSTLVTERECILIGLHACARCTTLRRKLDVVAKLTKWFLDEGFEDGEMIVENLLAYCQENNILVDVKSRWKAKRSWE